PFAGLTVHENIAIGAHLSRRSRADALDAAAEVASTVGLGAVLGRPAASLTVAGRKRLEVARALAAEPELLLLDEVLAGLNPAEVATMVPIIRGIVDDGTTILMIEHVMQAAMRLAQDVVVLAEGRIIAAGAPQVVVDNPSVVEAYLGHGAAARLSTAGGAHVSRAARGQRAYRQLRRDRGAARDRSRDRRRRDRRRARLERRGQVNAQSHDLRCAARNARLHPLRR